MAAIRELFEALVENCKKTYIPNDCLTIDEMLIAFRGRCKFRQYIPSKPAKINTYYNSTKCGVDVADELCSTYDVSRNSKKWPLTIVYASLNIAAINSLIINRINNNSNMKRRRFIKKRRSRPCHGIPKTSPKCFKPTP